MKSKKQRMNRAENRLYEAQCDVAEFNAMLNTLLLAQQQEEIIRAYNATFAIPAKKGKRKNKKNKQQMMIIEAQKREVSNASTYNDLQRELDNLKLAVMSAELEQYKAALSAAQNPTYRY